MSEISVIIPVFNSEDYLCDCLNSILNQSFDDFEVICIDEGSTDRSLSILNQYLKKDPRIKVILEKNMDSGISRNNGLEKAEGKYVFFMDSNDTVEFNFLEMNYKNIKSNDSDIVFFKIAKIKNNEIKSFDNYFPFENVFEGEDFMNFTINYKSIKKYVLNSCFAPWTKFYRKDFLLKHDDLRFAENISYEDVPFHVKTLLKASKISFLPEVLYFYRPDRHHTSTFKNTPCDIFKIINIVGDFLNNEGFSDFKKEYEFFKIYQVINHMTLPVDDAYFKFAKIFLKDIDLDKNNTIPEYLKDRYNVFFSSKSPQEYQKKIKVRLLKEENEKLIKEKKALEIKKQMLLSSRSWKITRFFRKIFNRFR